MVGLGERCKVLRRSLLHQEFEINRSFSEAVILGHCIYPNNNWLTTSIQRPIDGTKAAFNRAQKNTRLVAERTDGNMKNKLQFVHANRSRQLLCCTICRRVEPKNFTCNVKDQVLAEEVQARDNQTRQQLRNFFQ